MKADYVAYSKAASVSLLGMVLQLGLGLALLLYSVIGNDHAAQSGAYLVLSGAAIWLALAAVFDQHRRERIEFMEQQTLQASGGASSAFETSAEDLRVAARRLNWMHSVLLPVSSVLLGVTLMVIGGFRLQAKLAPGALDLDKFVAPQQKGWAIAIGVGLAVIGFVFARFVSGMAKQPVWANLRAGAGAIVGAAVVGIAIAAAHFAQTAGTERVLLYMQVVMPCLLIVLGAEMILNLLLNFYRPRKAGEVPRPAFDSRILSFIASPDRVAESIGGAISYQFGVDVTGSWAYRLLSKSAGALVLIGLGIVWLLTCFEVVEPDQRAIRVRLGEDHGEVGPGLYLKYPWPLEVFVTESTGVQEMLDLATPKGKTRGAILWTNDHQVAEVYAIVLPTTRTTSKAGGAGTPSAEPGTGESGEAVKDVAIVAVEIPLIYTVKDLAKFENFAAPGAREGLIKALAQRVVLGYLSTVTEDDLLGRQRPEISSELKKRIQATLDAAGAGVEVIVACVEGVHPPQQENAAKAFEKVTELEQNGIGYVEQGRTEAIRVLTEAVGSVELAQTISKEIDVLRPLPEGPSKLAQEEKIEALIRRAGGQAAAMLAGARADRWRTHMAARGRAEAYVAQVQAYRAAPEIYRATKYFEALADVMKNARVYIVNDDARYGLRITNDLKDNEATIDALTAPEQ